MLQSPSYIHFRTQWQVLGLDAAGQWPDKKTFLDLLNQLNDLSTCGDFDDFVYRADRCEMAKLRGSPEQAGQAFTKLVCAPNQITLVEEWTESPADQFKQSLVDALNVWFRLFPNTVIIAQKCCLRALVEPATMPDSRGFLGDRVMKIGKQMEKTFERMPFKVGFTFTCLRQIEEYKLFIDATVNSWRDNKSVWVQVEGTYPMERPMNATNPEQAKRPFEDCQQFLEHEVLGFLRLFDMADN